MLPTCRICLRSNEFILKDIDQFATLIKNIAQIELILNNEFSRKICEDCSIDLQNAEILREMLIECNDAVNIIKSNKDKEYIKQNDVTPDSEGAKVHHISTNLMTKVNLRDKKRIQTLTNLKARHSMFRPPVKEIDTKTLKKEPKYECQYCNTPQQDLETHIINSHPTEPLNFRCRFCDSNYHKFSSLKDHVYKIHKVRKKIPCEDCDAIFTLPCRLKEHKLKAHSDERNFVCTFCTARFKLKSNLKLHMRVHSGEKRYKCEFCDKAYAHYSDWKTHHMSHTGNWKYKCDICNKGFYKPSALKIHQKIHLVL